MRILDGMRVDFEYDGEMSADIALNRELMAQYPFSRLTGPANVLVMPAFHSASISTKMLQELGGAMVLGPLIVGLDKPVQIVSLGVDRRRHRQHGGACRVQHRRLRGRAFSGVLDDHPPTTVVFDVGNVLLRWDPRNLYRKIFDDEEKMEWFLSTICTPEWNIEQDRGRDWEEAVALLVDRHPDHETPIRAFHERWHETVSGAIEDNVAVLNGFAKPASRPIASPTSPAPKFAEAKDALSVPLRLRRHRRVGRRAAPEAGTRDLPACSSTATA